MALCAERNVKWGAMRDGSYLLTGGTCQHGCGDVNYLPGLGRGCHLLAGEKCQLGCGDVNYLPGLGGDCQLLTVGCVN